MSVSGFRQLAVIGIIVALSGCKRTQDFVAEEIGSTDQAKEATVKSNMRTMQISSELYAAKHAVLYPASVTDAEFQSFLPGGENADRTARQLVNPFSNQIESPIQGLVQNVAATSHQQSCTR